MKQVFYILSLFFMLVSCVSNHDEPDIPDEPKTADRTVLVYIVANNNLGTRNYDIKDIKEMCEAARQGGIGNSRLLVMHQRPGAMSVLKEINRKGEIDTLAVYGTDVNAVSIEHMRRTFDDMRRLAPAHNYGIVLWSHAMGWLQDGWKDPDDGRLRTFGQDAERAMNVTALAEALDGQGFDYVYFDCCHMASVEVAYELRHSTDYIVASAAELPNNGMPYDINIPELTKATPDLVKAAENTFRSYDDLTGENRSCTMTVIATAGLDKLAEATARVYDTAVENPNLNGLQYFDSAANRFADLEHYVERIATDSEALEAWRKALGECVLYHEATPWMFSIISISRHCGLSTYPVTSVSGLTRFGYDGLEWARQVASHLPLKND